MLGNEAKLKTMFFLNFIKGIFIRLLQLIDSYVI